MWARDADTGQAVWFYQMAPHDLFDWDGINEDILLDLPWQGSTRKVLVRPDRDGYMYLIDRTTGEVLSATPYIYTTTTKGVDLKSGQLIHVDEKKPQVGKETVGICPMAPGVKGLAAIVLFAAHRLVYVPHENMCMDEEYTDANYIAGTPYIGADVRYYAGPGGNMGELMAWDPISGKKVWTIPDKFPTWSGTVATGGDLVFFGTMDGWFKAADARTGKILWQFKTGSGIIGQPITYKRT